MQHCCYHVVFRVWVRSRNKSCVASGGSSWRQGSHLFAVSPRAWRNFCLAWKKRRTLFLVEIYFITFCYGLMDPFHSLFSVTSGSDPGHSLFSPWQLFFWVTDILLPCCCYDCWTQRWCADCRERTKNCKALSKECWREVFPWTPVGSPQKEKLEIFNFQKLNFATGLL